MVSYSTNTPTHVVAAGSDDVPLFQQIARRLADDIIEGQVAEGERAPSVSEIAVHWRINPATALKGVNQLVADGVLEKRRGVGMFVVPGAQELLRRARRAEFRDRHLLPLVDEARRLGIPGAVLAEMVAKEVGP